MNKHKMIEALDDALADFNAAISKMEFVMLKSGLTEFQKSQIDNFYDKLKTDEREVLLFQEKVCNYEGQFEDDRIEPVIFMLKVTAKKYHESALDAIHYFYPE